MGYDVGYFGLETRVLEPLENPFVPKVLPNVTGTFCNPYVRIGPLRKWRTLAASRNFGLLFGGKVFDDLPFLGAILRLMQSVIEGRQFDVWLEPVRILFDDNLQITQSGFVLP